MSRELIFAVEDEEHIRQLIRYNLEANGFNVHVFDNGESLMKEVESSVPALFILDLMLPGMDGLEVCKTLRASPQTKNTPIIMLTARSDEFDKVLGLELGADDYLTKPFSVRELAARVRALLRRAANTTPGDNEVIRAGNIEINTARHEARKEGKLLEMTLKEFELLKLLMLNKGRVLTRERLLDEIWGFDYYGETRTVDVHIRHVRQKIEDNGDTARIETVRGVGYRFSDAE